ncbi:MAG: ABC transporter ATP-binding protein [Halanaerobiales bacterium]
MNTYQRLFKYLKPYKLQLIIGAISVVIVGILSSAVPLVIKVLIDYVLLEGNMVLLNMLAISGILLYVIKGIFNYLQVYLITGTGEKVVVDLRNDIYHHLQGLSLSFFSKNTTGDLMSRITNDVNIIQQSIAMSLSNLILQPVVIIASVAALFIISWKLALTSFVIIPLVAYAMNKTGSRMRKVSNRIQERLSVVTTILQETLSGIRIVKAFNMEGKEKEKFEKANDETLIFNIKGVKIRAVITPIVELIIAFGMVFLLWYGGQEVFKGNMTVGDLPTFLGYLGILVSPVNILSRSYNILQKAAGAADRIFDLLDIDERVSEKKDAVEMPRIEGNVKFKDVSFSYEQEQMILKDINFQAEPGEMIALVGHSGAGKSTLANLIPRFYDIDKGEILIDNIDIRKVKLKSLRKQIGIVPQETILFKGTIAENIMYGSTNANREDVIEAARKANAHNFITEFKNGYKSEVGERGVSLSGGQRQRIAIARAILTNPRILILDEATSSLDTKSEALVQEALERLMKDRTTFVIAHRLSTIFEADKIIVLEKGQIVEIGSHQELMEKGGYYYRLYQTQFE